MFVRSFASLARSFAYTNSVLLEGRPFLCVSCVCVCGVDDGVVAVCFDDVVVAVGRSLACRVCVCTLDDLSGIFVVVVWWWCFFLLVLFGFGVKNVCCMECVCLCAVWGMTTPTRFVLLKTMTINGVVARLCYFFGMHTHILTLAHSQIDDDVGS